MSIIAYWLREYAEASEFEEVKEREEEIRHLKDTNIEGFLDWCADEGIEYVEADMDMWEASFNA